MYCLYRGEIVQFFILFLSSYTVVFVEPNNVICSFVVNLRGLIDIEHTCLASLFKSNELLDFLNSWPKRKT